MTSSLGRRLGKLSVIWPVACPACAARPAVVGVEPDEDLPVFPARCPSCGRAQPPIVLIVGVDVALL